MWTRLRFLTAGESHGPALTVVLDGVPAGLPLRGEDVERDLRRRQKGYGRGGRMKIERDAAALEAGVRNGETLGGPIALRIENRDHANWKGRMGPEPFEAPPEPVTLPRPGHADLAGALKYDRADARDVLERASARETAARVAAGAVARALLAALGVRVGSRVVSIAGVRDEGAYTPGEVLDAQPRLDESELRAMSSEHEARMKERIHALSHAGDTAGGVIEIVVLGAPPGLGSHTQWDRKLDARLAQAVMSVQAIKAVEVGDGWSAADSPGSRVHDPIGYDAGERRFVRASNHAGGVEGGTSNGEPLVVRAAMKPIATLRAALPSADLRSKGPAPAAHERSDVCAVPAAAVVLEAMVCLAVADALLEKTGGDSLGEVRRNLDGYLARLRAY